MSAPDKPDTLEKTVDRLWYLIEGLNGDGMKSKLDRVCDWMEKKEREETAQSIARGSRERRKVSAREWVLIAATAFPTMAYLGFEIWKGVHT